MIKVLTNWNSIFTIYAAPHAEDAHEIGDQVGQHLAIRAICLGKAGFLKPLAEYFEGLVQSAEHEIQNLSSADMKDYEENAEMSWMYMQLMQRKFAKQARVKIIEIAKTEVLRRQERQRRAAAAAPAAAAAALGGGGAEGQNLAAAPSTSTAVDKEKQKDDGAGADSGAGEAQ
jgi:hypothetical protein